MRADPPSERRLPLAWPDAVAWLALALFWFLAVSASLHWSHTSDELPHITAGYAYDRFGDFRMQPENGVLPQRLHGLAPLALGVKFPDDRLLWENSLFWDLGWRFFYSLGNPTDQMVAGARALNAFFGVALGLLLWRLARNWYGPWGGLLTAGLYALCPNFLFHSAQATSDLAAVLTLTLAAVAFWWHLGRRSAGSLVLAGLASGLALTAKFSGLLVAPIFTVLLGADARLRGEPGRRGARLAGSAAGTVGVAALALGVIWLCYGGRFAARGEGTPTLVQFSWPWPAERMLAGWKGALIARALEWHLLPEAYLRGLDYVLASEVARPSFLAGRYSEHGFALFFPTVFVAKTTLALLIAPVVAWGIAFRRVGSGDPARAALARWMPLVAVAAVTWLVAWTSSLNIGHRHILAVYPALFVAAGGLARLSGRWLALPVVLCGLQAAESFAIRPHYLSYFSPLLGGPSRAYRLVVDSSLDWGQDLPALRTWLEANRRPGEKLYLSYFGNAWPPHYGVRPTRFLPATGLMHPPVEDYPLEPGLYALSATSLAEVYTSFRGPWQEEWERALANTRDNVELHDRLRFARLCKYLQRRPPDALAGYSILIFRLDAAELDAALHGPVTGW